MAVFFAFVFFDEGTLDGLDVGLLVGLTVTFNGPVEGAELMKGDTTYETSKLPNWYPLGPSGEFWEKVTANMPSSSASSTSFATWAGSPKSVSTYTDVSVSNLQTTIPSS